MARVILNGISGGGGGGVGNWISAVTLPLQSVCGAVEATCLKVCLKNFR